MSVFLKIGVPNLGRMKRFGACTALAAQKLDGLP
jgi:hypothetical protein